MSKKTLRSGKRGHDNFLSNCRYGLLVYITLLLVCEQSDIDVHSHFNLKSRCSFFFRLLTFERNQSFSIVTHFVNAFMQQCQL